LEKMVNLELSREEWNEMKAFKADESLELSNHFAFYENAEKRDEAFFKNLSGRMKKEGLNASLLVTGGFHTEGLTERFKRAGISFILITPQIGSVPENSPYAQQMQGNVSWKDYFEVENGKINLYKAFVRGARDRLIIMSPVSRHLLKAWRDEIIRDLARKKELTKTREYVRFLDEISRNNTKDEARGPQGLARINRFITRLRHLESTNQLTEQKVLRLLQPATYGVPATQSQIAIGSDLNVIGSDGVALMPAVPMAVEKSTQIVNEAPVNPDNAAIGIGTPRRRAEVRDGDEKHGNALAQILSGLWNPLKEEKVGAEEVLNKKEQFTDYSGGGLLEQEGISQFTRRNLYKWGLLGLLTGVMSRGVSGQTELKVRQFSEEQKAAWKTILKSQGFEEERMNRILAASPESAAIFLVRELAKSMVERSFEIRQQAKLYRDAASAVSPRLASLIEAWIERLDEPVEKKIHLLDEMNEKYFAPAGTLIESRQAGGIWMPVLHRADKFSDVEKLTFGDVTVHVIYGDRTDGMIDRRAGFRLGRIQTAFINQRVHLNNAELFHRLVHNPAKTEPPVDDMSLYRQLSISLLKKDLEGLTVDKSAEKQMQSTLHNELLHAYEIAKGIDQDGHHETRSDLNQVVATDIPFHAIAHIAGNVLMGGDYGIQSADTLDLIYEEAKKSQLIKVDPEKEIKESIAGALKRLGVKDALFVLNGRLAAFNQLKPDQKEGLRQAAKSAFQNRFKSPLPANFSIKIEKPILSAVTQNMAAHLSGRVPEFRSQGGVTENELAELSNVIYWRDHLLYEDGWISDSIAGILQPVFEKAARQVLGNRSPQSSQERLAVLEKALEILTEGTGLRPETPLVSDRTDQQGSPLSWGPVLIGAVGLSVLAAAGFFIHRRM
ncbi:MAG TPA: hypothetical protein VD913_01100, partial [bacterium]|nr:hypothetical protein [bacterium]